ncbi:MAG TPA: RES family NAD+ phosphorylase [Chloroflexota bacterium]|nr:RES family NAD+ phosphorylase [Chloroflexota bacterium]
MTIRWYRLAANPRTPVYWGLTPPRIPSARFDAPKGEFGVLYAGVDAYCAFIETYGHVTGTRWVTLAALRERSLFEIRFGHPLRLVNLTGHHLAGLGADSGLFSGDYTVSQAWSLAFFNHPSAPDGLYYHTCHDPSRMSLALYQRGDIESQVSFTSLGTLADSGNRALLGKILDTYRFALLP